MSKILLPKDVRQLDLHRRQEHRLHGTGDAEVPTDHHLACLQDPFLFSATMRVNLDPFKRYSNKQMWEALEVAHLKSFIASLPGGLNFEVNKGGKKSAEGQSPHLRTPSDSH